MGLGRGELAMSKFKCRHFEGEIILWAVGWYCRYGISYRDLEQMMGERGVPVDHSTIYRWFRGTGRSSKSDCAGSGAVRNQRVGDLTKPISRLWSVDVLVPSCRQTWKHNRFLSFVDTERQSGETLSWQGAERLEGLAEAEVINTDKAPTYGLAISELKGEGKYPEGTVHRQVKYLNNVVEADHGKLKQLIRPVRAFKTLKTAYATIRGF